MSSTYLRSFLRNGTASTELPSCHTTSSFRFATIMDESRLRMKPCEVFNEDLVYFFYGKASYRLSSGNKPTHLESYAPVVIVLKTERLSNPIRIAPFDTGAYKEKLYSDYLNDEMVQDGFLLEDTTMAGKLITVYYGDNKLYLTGKVVNKNPAGFRVPYARTYYDIITAKTPKYDDRCKTIEIQFANHVDISNIECLILPDVWLDDHVVRAWVAGHLSEKSLKTYVYKGNAAGEYHALLNDKLMEYLIESNYL